MQPRCVAHGPPLGIVRFPSASRLTLDIFHTISISGMKFEFDPDKSASNKRKHGIDFLQAQALWQNPTAEFRSKDSAEPRSLVIGKIQEKFWTAIVAHRRGAIRIISVRRSRDEEKNFYL